MKFKNIATGVISDLKDIIISQNISTETAEVHVYVDYGDTTKEITYESTTMLVYTFAGLLNILIKKGILDENDLKELISGFHEQIPD